MVMRSVYDTWWGRLPLEPDGLNWTMKFALRQATLEDATNIARVHVSSWQTSYRHLLPSEFLETLDVGAREVRWKAIFERNESTTFVAVLERRLEGEVVGFVSAGSMLSSIGNFQSEIHALYTLETVQGKGVGRLLFTAAQNYLLAQNFPNMALWVLADNPARGFYEHLGGVLLEIEQEIELGGVKRLEVAYGWRLTN